MTIEVVTTVEFVNRRTLTQDLYNAYEMYDCDEMSEDDQQYLRELIEEEIKVGDEDVLELYAQSGGVKSVKVEFVDVSDTGA